MAESEFQLKAADAAMFATPKVFASGRRMVLVGGERFFKVGGQCADSGSRLFIDISANFSQRSRHPDQQIALANEILSAFFHNSDRNPLRPGDINYVTIDVRLSDQWNVFFGIIGTLDCVSVSDLENVTKASGYPR